MYQYKAKVIRWVDGDTLLCLIDLGFYSHKEERLRLARIDTPELRGAEKERGKQVKAIVTERYPPDTIVMVESKKRDNAACPVLDTGDGSLPRFIMRART